MADATNTYNDDLDLVDADPEAIRDALLTSLETSCGEPLYPGDERRIYAEGLMAVFVSLFSSINDSARQTTLKYARGQYLDAIGERVGAYRLGAESATTRLQFSTTVPKGYNIIIPKWTKVTADGNLYFATDEETVLTAGDYYVEVNATALYGGSGYNGLLPGSLTTIVDQIAGIEGVTNLTETAGGDDGEPYTEEGDNAFRERIKLAVKAFSTAGPMGAYEYWTKSADANILDVNAIVPKIEIEETLTVNNHKASLYADGIKTDSIKVYAHGSSTAATIGTDYTLSYEYTKLEITLLSDGALYSASQIDITGTKDLAGHVYDYVLMKNMLLPSEAQCLSIYNYINSAERRPMCDYLHVLAPERVNYDIELTYYTSAAHAAACLEAVEGNGGAVERYIELQGSEIGRNLNPEDLHDMIDAYKDPSGARLSNRVVITKPVYTELAENQVAYFTGNKTVVRVIE